MSTELFDISVPVDQPMPSVEEFYIPPEGICFQLFNRESKKVIFTSFLAGPQVGHCSASPINESTSYEQYFTLIHGTNNNKGLYALKSKFTSRVVRINEHKGVSHEKCEKESDIGDFRYADMSLVSS